MTFQTMPGLAEQSIRKLVPALMPLTTQTRPAAPGMLWPAIVMTSVVVRFAQVIPPVVAPNDELQVCCAAALVQVPNSTTLMEFPVVVAVPTRSPLPTARVVLPLSAIAPVPVVMPTPPLCEMPVITLPFSEMLPVPVWNVPLELDQSKFARPPSELTLLPEANDVVPLIATAPVPVLKENAPVCAKFAATVVVPFSETAPVPLVNAAAPVWAKSADVVIRVGVTENFDPPATCRSMKRPEYPVTAFTRTATPVEAVPAAVRSTDSTPVPVYVPVTARFRRCPCVSGAAKLPSDEETAWASDPAETENRLPLKAPPRTFTAP